MNYFFITGTGKGIGKSLAEELLKNASNKVIGISRSNTITASNFEFIPLNLNDLSEVKKFSFPEIGSATGITLINNAGVIGEIKPLGCLSDNSIIEVFNVNLISPALLTNKFIRAYEKQIAEKIILHISSGAGKYPIDSWSAYCASKSGIDMFTRVGNEEQQVRNKNAFLHISIAPGIIDTAMQEQIRSADQKDFFRLNDFISYKNDRQLKTPEETAAAIVKLLSKINITGKEAVIALKDYQL